MAGYTVRRSANEILRIRRLPHQNLRVLSMLFLPVVSPLNQTLWSQEERKWSATEKLLIVKQILLISTIGSVQRTVWRICILMLECKGLTVRSHRPKHHLLLLSHQVENFCPLRSGGHVSNDCEIPTDKEFPECPSKIAVSFQSCYWFYLIYVLQSILIKITSYCVMY